MRFFVVFRARAAEKEQNWLSVFGHVLVKDKRRAVVRLFTGINTTVSDFGFLIRPLYAFICDGNRRRVMAAEFSLNLNCSHICVVHMQKKLPLLINNVQRTEIFAEPGVCIFTRCQVDFIFLNMYRQIACRIVNIAVNKYALGLEKSVPAFRLDKRGRQQHAVAVLHYAEMMDSISPDDIVTEIYRDTVRATHQWWCRGW